MHFSSSPRQKSHDYYTFCIVPQFPEALFYIFSLFFLLLKFGYFFSTNESMFTGSFIFNISKMYIFAFPPILRLKSTILYTPLYTLTFHLIVYLGGPPIVLCGDIHNSLNLLSVHCSMVA